MGTINIQSTDLSHKAGLTYTGTSDKTIDVGSLVTKVSSTDNAIARYDGTGGAIQNSSVYIDDSGNVGIGTSSPVSLLHINQSTSGLNAHMKLSNIYTGSGSADGFDLVCDSVGAAHIIQRENADLAFRTNNVERMRIDSSGNLLVGTTTKSARISVAGGAEVGYYINKSSSGSYDHARYSTDGTIYCKILVNGDLRNWNNSYGAISDVNQKDNIVDATPKLQDLMQVRIRNFNMKGDTNKQIGVVAQELEQVFPGLVQEDSDGVKGVKYSVFVPMLIKAIQEQQAIITSLTARIEALEIK